MCQGKDCHSQTLGEKAIEVQRGRVDTWKGYPVETGVSGAAGGTLHVSMRMHASPCESISKAGGHYQLNGPADGCSCHTRLSALEDHRRWTALLRGRPGESHRSGQGSQGLYEPLTGSYWNFPDHNQHFHSIIMRVKLDTSCFNCHGMPQLGTLGLLLDQLTELNYFRLLYSL